MLQVFITTMCVTRALFIFLHTISEQVLAKQVHIAQIERALKVPVNAFNMIKWPSGTDWYHMLITISMLSKTCKLNEQKGCAENYKQQFYFNIYTRMLKYKKHIMIQSEQWQWYFLPDVIISLYATWLC